MKPLLWLVAAGLTSGASYASAQSFDVTYRARLAGLPVGQARLTSSVDRSGYLIEISGSYGAPGFRGTFSATAKGAITGDSRVLPESYKASFDGPRQRTTKLSFVNGNVFQIDITPPLTADELKGRAPIKNADLQTALDPLTSLVAQLIRVSVPGDPCQGVARVITGASRFDVQLERNPSKLTGSTVSCRLAYQPVAGHKPSEPGFLKDRKVELEVPASAGAPRLPIRIEIPLALGALTITREP